MGFGNTSGGLRPIVVPILEELGFLAPPLVMLWRNRRVSYALTTSDIFVGAAICGAGFAMVEEGAMRAAGTWGTAPIPFLPGCIIVGDRIYGEHLSNAQYVWGGLAGAAIGLALYLRHHKIRGLQIACAGVVVGLVDHVINNVKAADRSSGIGGDLLLAPFSLV